MVLHCTLLSSFFWLLFFLISSHHPTINSTNVKSYEWMQLYCGRRRNIRFPFLFLLISSSHSKGAINWLKLDNALGLSVFLKFNATLFCTILWVKAIPYRVYLSWQEEALVHYRSLNERMKSYHQCHKETLSANEKKNKNKIQIKPQMNLFTSVMLRLLL